MNIEDLEVRLKKLEDENLILKEQLSELLVKAYQLRLDPIAPFNNFTTYPSTWIGNTSNTPSTITGTINGNYTFTADGLKITY